jgi:hypothetical protein
MSDWLAIYLAGCAVAVLLWLLAMALFAMLDWLAKGSVARKNLKKLDPPDTETFWTKFWTNAVLLLLLDECRPPATELRAVLDPSAHLTSFDTVEAHDGAARGFHFCSAGN